MENVWKVIDEENGQFFASCDKEFLGKIKENSDYTKLADHYKLDLRVIPLHFIGNILKAKLLILNLNPGMDEEYYTFYQNNESYQEMIYNNLTLKKPKFFEFDYYITNNEGYWSRLKPLFEDEYLEKINRNQKGEDTKKLDEFFTKTVALIEFFPYHSQNFSELGDIFDKTVKEMKGYLPSQQFVFNIIKERVQNGDVVIVFSRSIGRWMEAIPELKVYDKVYQSSNPRNPTFKPENILKRNMGKDLLDII
jgi:hypothetical protein